MADARENQKETQRTESTSIKENEDEVDGNTERRPLPLKKRGRALDLGASEAERANETKPEKKKKEVSGLKINEAGQIRDDKDPRDVERQRRSHEKDPRLVQQKKMDHTTQYDWGESESQRIFDEITDRRHETAPRSWTEDRGSTLSDQRASESRNESQYQYPTTRLTLVCKFFKSGFCRDGLYCKFLHPKDLDCKKGESKSMPEIRGGVSADKRASESPYPTTRLPPVCKYFQSGFCRDGLYCKFLHPKDTDGKKGQQTESGSKPEIRATTIPNSRERDPRRGDQENVQEQSSRERTIPESRDRDPRERLEDTSGRRGENDWKYKLEKRYNKGINEILGEIVVGVKRARKENRSVLSRESPAEQRQRNVDMARREDEERVEEQKWKEKRAHDQRDHKKQ